MTDKKKGTLAEKLLSACVGYSLLSEGVDVVIIEHDFAEKVGNTCQRYVGSVGAGVIEFALPAIVGAAYLGLAAIATVATYEFLTKKSQ